jgi:hypothetical protein
VRLPEEFIETMQANGWCVPELTAGAGPEPDEA